MLGESLIATNVVPVWSSGPVRCVCETIDDGYRLVLIDSTFRILLEQLEPSLSNALGTAARWKVHYQVTA